MKFCARVLCGSISVLLPLAIASCSSNPGLGPSTTASAVSGPADDHCGAAPNLTVQTVGTCLTNEQPANTASCGVTFAPDTTPPPDGGATGGPVYGPTLYNSSGYDDDCKYALAWTATPVTVNADVTFTLTAKYLTAAGPGDPVHCAGVIVEAYSGNTAAFSPTARAAEKGSTGTYDIGPVQLTQSGMWTIRFHLFDLCGDAPADSPHGHGAFYVMVP